MIEFDIVNYLTSRIINNQDNIEVDLKELGVLLASNDKRNIRMYAITIIKRISKEMKINFDEVVIHGRDMASEMIN